MSAPPEHDDRRRAQDLRLHPHASTSNTRYLIVLAPSERVQSATTSQTVGNSTATITFVGGATGTIAFSTDGTGGHVR
ncbi:MAG: hypothetical protein BGO98_24925 [Myxococcales bacterium 68-20]|nr:MAG: hypothetical protein BGO98_24925 [Myxococcales bacterium 68-20]